MRLSGRGARAAWCVKRTQRGLRPQPNTGSLAKNAKSAKENRATMPSDLGALCVPFDAAQGSALREA